MRAMLTVGLLVVLCVPRAWSEPAPPDARERAKHRLAIRAAAQTIMDAVQAPPADRDTTVRRLAADLAAHMQRDVKTHSEPSASRALCFARLTEARRHMLTAKIDEALARAREHSALPVQRNEIIRLLGDDWEQRLDTETKAFASRYIDTAFGTARQQSVALQRDQIRNRGHMPGQEELDARLNRLAAETGHTPPKPADLAALTGWLASLDLPPDRPLFQEVRVATHERADRLADKIRQQYRQQLTTVREAGNRLPDNLLDADTIHTRLVEAVETAIKALRVEEMHVPPDDRATIYGPFSVIRNEARRLASALQIDRLEAAIGARQDIPLEPDAIASTIQSNPAIHQAAENSRRRLIDEQTPILTPWFVERLVEQADPPDTAPTGAQLTALIADSPRLAASIRTQVARKIDSLLPDVRTRIAGDQLKALFGASPDTLAVLPAEAVEAVWAGDRCTPARNFEEACQSLDKAGLLMADPAAGRLLNEARQHVVETCNRLIPPACRAMREQGNQLMRLEQAWTEQLRRHVAEGRSLERITSDWVHELDRRWRARADRDQLAYPALFGRTLDQVDKTVRKLFDARQAEIAQDAAGSDPEADSASTTEEEAPSPTEPPPPEEPPEPTTPTTIEEMLETLDFVLLIHDTQDRSEAILMDGNGVANRVAFRPDNVTNAVETIYAIIVPAIEAATRDKAAARDRGPALLNLLQRLRDIQLKVAVLVGSEQMRHMTGILLRQRVEAFVEDWNGNPDNPDFDLDWEDNLELAP